MLMSFMIDNSGLLYTSVASGVSTLLTLLYQGWSAERKRKWDLQDQANKLEAAKIELAKKTEETKQEMLDAIKGEAAKLGVRADAAYDEANNTNAKIATVATAGVDASRVMMHTMDKNRVSLEELKDSVNVVKAAVTVDKPVDKTVTG